MTGEPYAYLGGRLATGLRQVSHDPSVLDTSGFWAVVATFEGTWTFARFDDVRPAPMPVADEPWPGVPASSWTSSMSEAEYRQGVAAIRHLVAAGEVYQVNLCRVMTARVTPSAPLAGLGTRLGQANPAPFAAQVVVPSAGVDVLSASPELFLSRDCDDVASAPIKGTGARADDLTAKDVAENVMIVDLVRNDLGRVCEPGSVTVDDVLALERHPGLVHLVSTVRGRLRPGTTWPALLAATFPPGSVSGAPKHTALAAIRAIEPVGRGPYCGAVGWVDTGTGTAELAVGIRTFWRTGSTLRFGTGAGITWGSDPGGEWRETQLKARRLLGLAAQDGRTP